MYRLMTLALLVERVGAEGLGVVDMVVEEELEVMDRFAMVS